VTTYRLVPGRGVLPRKLDTLTDAWTLALGRDVRLTAPNDGAVPLEVPNDVRATVQVASVFDPDEREHDRLSLTVPFGIDTATNPVHRLLSSLPHLLVAGATGQGKSVFVNDVIVSLVAQAGPDDLELVLVDPKRVELAQYASLPHLRGWGIVTDVADAPGKLAAVVAVMEQRYKAMQDAGRRQSVERPLVVVIDEYADLILQLGKAVEEPLVRIAQLGRAANVHLILATQYPNAKVVTPLIKQNIPSRVCFRVADHVASNVVLGQSGAERLSGAGDGLVLLAGKVTAIRFQAPRVSEDELVRAVAAWPVPSDVVDTEPLPDPSEVEARAQAARDQAAADAQLARSIVEQRSEAAPSAEPELTPEQVIEAELATEMANRIPILAETVALQQQQLEWLVERLYVVEDHLKRHGVYPPAPRTEYPRRLT
jgi:S-DNA-T family DNA segregation ATPase FtsK/SpoIIIE